ncbi:MAG: class I SAM-dependent methyltransferase [candidate division Zixibacteria bacterium]|nr:class I SAM-dependent methyltransferase [candidate division Zixibacteria bacterium]
MLNNPYQLPELYELAFSWRDYTKAVDFITEAAKRAGLPAIGSMVELGCGPGQYCREFARRGITSYGVDLSPEMALYAQKLYDDENLPGYVLESDFRNFKLEKPVDLAICMMATFNLLLTNNDVVDHFNSVADNLTEGGIYLIELPHPRDTFRMGSCSEDKWEMEKDDLKLSIDWSSNSVFDPAMEVDHTTVRLTTEKNGITQIFESPEDAHRLGLGHLKALIELSGRFRIVEIYGDLDINQTFDKTKKSWRLIPVLQKTGA